MKWILFFAVFLVVPAVYSCSISLSITSDSRIFENSRKIEFYNKVDGADMFVVEYWVEDSYGNIIKSKRNTTNENKKSFTPKNLDTDIIIKNRLVFPECTNASAEKRIFHKNSENGAVISFEIDKSAEKLRRMEVNSYKNEKNSRILKLVPYFLITLMTIISIVLIWRR
jgi:hypothetical protein